jgi:hypothetical protein
MFDVKDVLMGGATMLHTEALDLIRGILREPVSDYDILAVIDGPSSMKERVALSNLWRGRLAKLGLDADILVKTPTEIAEYRDKLGSIINAALRTGIVL